VNSSTGCISCHMPKVQTDVPHTTFTDHVIRVDRPGGSRSSPGPGTAP
jgi:hypothetical protein